MRVFLMTVVSMMFWSGAGRAWAQEIKSPAVLVSAKAVAYVELQQPGALAKEVAALLEGSYLGDLPDSLAPLMARTAPGRGHDRGMTWIGLIPGLLTSPEVVREIGRIEGAAVAITGLDKQEQNMPEFIVIVRPGDSNLPGLIMRGFMMTFAHGRSSSDGKIRTETRSSFERIAKVEGVGIYRMVERRFAWSEGEGRGSGKPQVRITGPALARLPNTLLIGSATLVEDTIRRAKGKGKGASLASSETFQEARRDAGSRPGLFTFANPAEGFAMLEKVDFGHSGPEGAATAVFRQLVGMVKVIVNPAALRAVADQISLENGTLRFRRRIYLDPKEKSPLLEILPTEAVPERLLHFVAPEAVAFAAVANDGGEKRWQRLLELADTLAKLTGDGGPLPSQLAGKLEAALGLEFGKEAGKIRGVALAVPSIQQFLKAGILGEFLLRREPPVVLLVEARDEQAASTLAKEVLPKVFALAAKDPELKPGERTVDGRTLSVLHGKRDYALYVGREGSTLVMGPNPHLVAQALHRGQKKQGMLSDAKIAKRIEVVKESVAMALVRPVTLAGFFLIHRSADVPPPPASKIEAEPNPRPAPAEKKPGNPGPRGRAAVKDMPKEARAIIDLLKNEQPLLMSITRTREQIAMEATYPGLRPLVGRVINFLLEATTLRDSNRGSPRPAPIEEAVPPGRTERPR